MKNLITNPPKEEAPDLEFLERVRKRQRESVVSQKTPVSRPLSYVEGIIEKARKIRERDMELRNKAIEFDRSFLLRHFSEEETIMLVEKFLHSPVTSTQEGFSTYGLYDLDEEKKRYISNEIRGGKVIEFGDGGRATNLRFMLESGVKDFRTVDPKHNTDGHTDGLSYLLQQPDESAIVMSFGVLEDGILDGTDEYSIPVFRKYNRLLGEEIYRVTPKGGITLHGLDSIYDLVNAGFTEEKILREFPNRKLVSLRKS